MDHDCVFKIKTMLVSDFNGIYIIWTIVTSLRWHHKRHFKTFHVDKTTSCIKALMKYCT